MSGACKRKHDVIVYDLQQSIVHYICLVYEKAFLKVIRLTSAI